MTTITLPRAVVEQALKALEGAAECVQQNYLPDKCGHDWDEQIIALRAALAQQAEPAQEPFGYLWPTGRHPEFRFTQQKRDGVDGTPVYTAPPQRKPLTKEEILRAFYAAENPPMSIRHGLSVVESARIVERAHGIKE